MADANLVLAVSRGLRPAQITGAIANAKSEVNQLVSANQIADEKTFVALSAANSLQGPSSFHLMV